MLRGLSLFTCVFVSWSLVGPAGAQTPVGQQPTPAMSASASPDLAATLTLDIRFKLVQELYGLDADQLNKIRATLSPQFVQQQQYDERVALTLRRLSVARKLVAEAPEFDETARGRQISNFDSQYYRIVADGPLSIAGIAKAAEQLLTKDQVAQARERIKVQLGPRLVGLGELDPYVLDRVLTGPVPAAELLQPVLPKPVPPERVPPQTAESAARSPQAQQPPAEAPKPRVPPKPAPPETEWPNFVEKTATELAYTADQKKQAQNVLAQTQAQVKAHRERHAADYAEAEKLTDAAKKAETLRKLNEPVDLLYEGMSERLESLASLEQLQKAGRWVPPPAASSPAPQVKVTEPPPKPVPPPASAPAVLPPAPAPVVPPTTAPAAGPALKPPPSPAPPIEQWSNLIQKAAKELAFTPEQQKSANQVLENYQTRAQAYRRQRKADFEAIEKLTDPTKKSLALTELNKGADSLYQEMTERIDSLATLEQLQKVGRAPKQEEPPAPAVPAVAPGGAGPAKVGPATTPPAKPADAPAPAGQKPKP